MNKIKIMHVVQTLDIGGLEKVVIDLVSFSNRNRFDFVVCCLSERGVFAGDLEKNGIKILFLNKRNGFDLGLVFKIASIIKKEKIDVLHTHNQRPQFYGTPAARISRVPFYIHTRHGKNDPDNYKNILLSRFFTAFTDKIVCVSDDIKRFAVNVERLQSNKLQVINNGIDISIFSGNKFEDKTFKNFIGVSQKTKLIGTVGRLAKIKNQHLLISTFKDTLKSGQDVTLLIIGDGPLREELVDYSCKLGLSKKVLFLGSRKDVPQILKILDVFVLSSTSEGMSLVLLEAMAAGVPMVVTDVGGNPELIEDGKNGFLVPSENVAAMSDAICKILSDESLQRDMADYNCKKALSEFGVEKMKCEYEELYELGVELKGVNNI